MNPLDGAVEHLSTMAKRVLGMDSARSSKIGTPVEKACFIGKLQLDAEAVAFLRTC